MLVQITIYLFFQSFVNVKREYLDLLNSILAKLTFSCLEKRSMVILTTSEDPDEILHNIISIRVSNKQCSRDIHRI